MSVTFIHSDPAVELMELTQTSSDSKLIDGEIGHIDCEAKFFSSPLVRPGSEAPYLRRGVMRMIRIAVQHEVTCYGMQKRMVRNDDDLRDMPYLRLSRWLREGVW